MSCNFCYKKNEEKSKEMFIHCIYRLPKMNLIPSHWTITQAIETPLCRIIRLILIVGSFIRRMFCYYFE